MRLYIQNSLIFLILFFAVSQSLCADSYRCGRKVVRTGDSTERLLNVCGKPRHRDRAREYIKVKGVHKNTPVQRWYYKQGSRSIERIILIYQGKIAGIEMGSR